MTDIQPCPFCGGPATVGGFIPWVECEACEATGPLGETNADAIAAWNRRIADAKDAEIARLRETLASVERYANHHGQHPNISPAEALGMIQHHPSIKAITRSYADGVIPATPDPYARAVLLEKALRHAHQSLRTIADLGGGTAHMQTVDEIRGYAHSRATAAETALHAQGQGDA